MCRPSSLKECFNEHEHALISKECYNEHTLCLCLFGGGCLGTTIIKCSRNYHNNIHKGRSLQSSGCTKQKTWGTWGPPGKHRTDMILPWKKTNQQKTPRGQTQMGEAGLIKHKDVREDREVGTSHERTESKPASYSKDRVRHVNFNQCASDLISLRVKGRSSAFGGCSDL